VGGVLAAEAAAAAAAAGKRFLIFSFIECFFLFCLNLKCSYESSFNNNILYFVFLLRK
jgi:hypothetical protein